MVSMVVKIKNIVGALVGKKNLDNYCYSLSSAKEFNDMVDKQGEAQITLSRERLAKVSFLANHEVKHYLTWDTCTQDIREWYLREADAILKELPALLETVKPNKGEI